MAIRRTYTTATDASATCTLSDPEELEIDGEKGWYVTLEFEGLDDVTEPMSIGGEDGVQALELALNVMQMVQLSQGLKWPASESAAPAVCDG